MSNNNSESRLANAYREETERLANNTVKAKKRFTGHIFLITISSILVFTIIAIIVFSSLARDSKSVHKQKKTLTDKEFTEICDMLDYSAITATVEKHSNITDTAHLIDADNDGRQELILITDNDFYTPIPDILTFDTADNPIMSSAVSGGAAGVNSFLKSDDYPVCLDMGYASVGVQINHYHRWTNTGWEEFAHVSDGYDAAYRFDEAVIDGRSLSSRDELEQELNLSALYLQNIIPDCLTTNYFSTGNPNEVIKTYEKHLKNYNRNFKRLDLDIDDDNNDETVFIVKDFASLWTNNIQTIGTDGDLMEKYLAKNSDIGTVVFLVDSCDSGVVFYTFCLNYCPNVSNLYFSWENCRLSITETTSGGADEQSFFCSPVEFVKETYQNDDDVRYVFRNYVYYLENHFGKKVHYRFADICRASGTEMLCIAEDSNNTDFMVLVVYRGKVICIYNPKHTYCNAVYLTKKDGKYVLLNYLQSIASNGINYSNQYSFWLTEFDEFYSEIELINRSTTADSDGEPTNDNNEFFNELNSYLDIATVCYDDYQLMGYSIMQNDDPDSQTDTKYLNISNCSTNKRGTVRVNSWLNFRELPDITAQRILIDPYDPESFVKQINGSSVTVLEVANTGDTENPIWLKIRIKYSDRELIGYSSQNYIDIDGIKEMSVGESFTVKADTNDSGIIWQSSDPSVLSIDKNSGNAKALKTGMVLVTVKSVSGLTDSCLIWVK